MTADGLRRRNDYEAWRHRVTLAIDGAARQNRWKISWEVMSLWGSRYATLKRAGVTVIVRVSDHASHRKHHKFTLDLQFGYGHRASTARLMAILQATPVAAGTYKGARRHYADRRPESPEARGIDGLAGEEAVDLFRCGRFL